MGSTFNSNRTNTNDDAIVQLANSAGTEIGTVANPVVVTGQTSNGAVASSWNSKLRVVEMNVASGGVARLAAITTTWTNVFSYSGSGYLAGFILNVETFLLWNFRLLIDGEEILGDATNGIQSDDISDDTIFDLDEVTDSNQSDLGLTEGLHEKLVFKAPLSIPIRYNSSVVIKLKRTSGATKRFQAGLVTLSKET